ncbi:uncharacterized protein B0P05DRAFT_591913 [Gilbertella persicaria]|uniref:uncharacterized protein n=1 Tax=Gilbertella persicaria TaxID=101096 RepID=UPI00221F3BCF|nr:uncharacterized protein B0P05DRAFT_591913 [Gilbertella persicaria]KAI8051046.1 hypothetical protein B0P05DRAFT_591913 [Gilbertella persicaria]
MPPKQQSAINSVVTDLIRAAAGAGAQHVADEDVDKYVADLILKEAEEKRKKYKDIGVKAYLPEPTQKPKPNTRFLLNVVKATDSHNQAVIRANEENVTRLRRERLERERHQTKKRRSQSPFKRHESRSTSKRHRSPSPEHSRSERDTMDHGQHLHSHHRSSSSKNKHKHRSPSPPQSVQYKGRGKVRINVSSMDKYFSKGYDPLLDIDSDQEQVKKEKKKSKKKKKKNKDSEDEIGPHPL